MGLVKKIIGLLLLLIIIVIGIVGVDLYLTATALSDVDPKDLVSSPSYSVSDNNDTVTITVDVDLPKGGFIPKSLIIELTVEFDGVAQTAETEVDLGEKKTLDLTFTLTTEHAQKLASGASLTVKASAKLTPTVFGNVIDVASQDVDLGTTQVSA